jgi:hypothetical protein
MQSKGRARSRQNAAYVLFTNASNADVQNRDHTEYDNYEEIQHVC